MQSFLFDIFGCWVSEKKECDIKNQKQCISISKIIYASFCYYLMNYDYMLILYDRTKKKQHTLFVEVFNDLPCNLIGCFCFFIANKYNY